MLVVSVVFVVPLDVCDVNGVGLVSVESSESVCSCGQYGFVHGSTLRINITVAWVVV